MSQEEKKIVIRGAKSGGVVVEVHEGYSPIQTLAFERASETDEQFASRITKAINEEIYEIVIERMKQIREKEKEAQNA